MSPITIKYNICQQDEKGGGGGAERRLNNICLCVCVRETDYAWLSWAKRASCRTSSDRTWHGEAGSYLLIRTKSDGAAWLRFQAEVFHHTPKCWGTLAGLLRECHVSPWRRRQRGGHFWVCECTDPCRSKRSGTMSQSADRNRWQTWEPSDRCSRQCASCSWTSRRDRPSGGGGTPLGRRRAARCLRTRTRHTRERMTPFVATQICAVSHHKHLKVRLVLTYSRQVMFFFFFV